ncbi:Katanin-Interacting Protein [Manis pentadactyla]|nr:Katanin-Interacting Protein [Manis pentadactyla]
MPGGRRKPGTMFTRLGDKCWLLIPAHVVPLSATPLYWHPHEAFSSSTNCLRPHQNSHPPLKMTPAKVQSVARDRDGYWIQTVLIGLQDSEGALSPASLHKLCRVSNPAEGVHPVTANLGTGRTERCGKRKCVCVFDFQAEFT